VIAADRHFFDGPDHSDRPLLPYRSIAMFSISTFLGAAGASLVYAAAPLPALDPRIRNIAGALAALGVGVVLWIAGAGFAWTFPTAWICALLLMWGSQYPVGPDDLIWVRVAATVVLVLLLAQSFR
jgi:hypothetical protein